MTIDDQLEHRPEELVCNTTQKQKPFHVVLIDIKKAAENDEIYCIENPLEDDDLAYVALSYRWGELQETLVDTHLGYIASITSFDLKDFIDLCKMISLESDLQHIKYVWVDAICVDQTNYERRKATIYQMTNIYEKAKYILAVPDLHLKHLIETNVTNYRVIEGSFIHHKYIYHLIHGNTEQLIAFDEKLLKELKVPNGSRQWLTKYTEYFMEGFMESRSHYSVRYNSENALDHIYQVSRTIHPQPQGERKSKQQQQKKKHQKEKRTNDTSDPVCKGVDCEEKICPLYLFEASHDPSSSSGAKRYWKQKILERNKSIRRSMELLQTLIVDWSSRVWVISEYSIARKKNNLKYWFTQLAPDSTTFFYYKHLKDPFTFFKFDFDAPVSDNDFSSTYTVRYVHMADHTGAMSDPVQAKFHYLMSNQLQGRSFLNMMLKSKASKCEDRFYAVLPLFSKYKHMLTHQVVDHWHVDSMAAVKLQLFEWMDTKDKLALLFLAGRYNALGQSHILPTFATTTITWGERPAEESVTSNQVDDDVFNFDLTQPSVLTLHHSQANDDDDHGGHDDPGLYFLHLKPKRYRLYEKAHTPEIKNAMLFKRLQLNDDDDLRLVKIVSRDIETDHQMEHPCIFLLGSLKKNKWILMVKYLLPAHAVKAFTEETNSDGFNIY
ncbi:hypothetical protein BCR42DRAFT_457300 [Absidia repens]|uniref:Heterokaryon incompatibility domain-containing protein n=1 Tax=Absidia repens TaxID=90262 RepID=A0A1X2HWW2_9FUNG|nr:hypothetical protein BCR42DRAFT_457300 [Absidia repens]